MLRSLKTSLILFAALMCLGHATNNIVNITSAFGAVGYVLGNMEHTVYPQSFLPAITSPALIWLSLAIIIGCEYAAGVLFAKGAWDMWRARLSSPGEFAAAKKFAVLGAGAALFVWFGLFQVIGGTLFQQWQTQAGWLSLEGAFIYAALPTLAVLYTVGTPDEY
jgi:predicted small integral membrane protein